MKHILLVERIIQLSMNSSNTCTPTPAVDSYTCTGGEYKTILYPTIPPAYAGTLSSALLSDLDLYIWKQIYPI